jgi:ATP-dependent DNA ligase
MKMQKALHLHLDLEKKTPKHHGQYMMFEKHDGWYGTLDLPEKVIRSSSGREIPSLREFVRDIGKKFPDVRGRLIFEIMIEGLEYNSFPILNGILNRKHEQADDVYLQVHDFLVDYKCHMNAHTRYKFASEIVERINDPRVRLSPMLGTSQSVETWKASAKRIWEKGGEGLILKQCEAVYMPEKRNHTLMKIKEELTLDMEVVGLVEGHGKYQGTTGALIVMEKNGNKHQVSGMTDKERNDWWVDKDSIIGKVVEIKAMKRLKDGSLREPRFKAVRWDKAAGDID